MSSEQTNLPSSRPQRILACVGCQQRKIKCDRNFPCAHCVKSKLACTPATKLPRRRRRRFAEHELLSQLRKYEELLRQNNIDFEPLISESPNPKASRAQNGHTDADQDTPESSSATISSPPPAGIPEVKSFWHAVHHRFGVEEDESELTTEEDLKDEVFSPTDTIFVHDNSLLFGRQTTIDLSPLHPEPAQIFRLWQLFLDNVNPLLGVIHTPSMQVSIVEAISNLQAIDATMEALMFAVYSMAIFSIHDDDCLASFSHSRSDLLTKYQFGCQQALINSEFLKSFNRDCLTAFFLYLFSYAHNSDPKALSSTVAIAIRIAQRMKLDRESDCAQYDFLEAEMRRRLWWALMLFDVRVSQIASEKNKTFLPTFTTRVPLNINDALLRAGTQPPPTLAHEQPTEAIYIVVRSTIGDFLRHADFNLAYNAPELAALARTPSTAAEAHGGQISHLEKAIESRYLKLCNPQDPLHLLTIWDSRALLARCRLMEAYSSSHLDASWTEEQSAEATQHAIRLLECDTVLNTSPSLKGFRWMTRFYFPFPGYIHLVKHLKRAPLDPVADRAWEVLSANAVVWSDCSFQDSDAFFKVLGKLVLGAWEARESALVARSEMVEGDIPLIVRMMRDFVARVKGKSMSPGSSADGAGTGAMQGDLEAMFAPPMPSTFVDSSTAGFGYGLQAPPWNTSFAMPGGGGSLGDVNQLDWSASMMDWGLGQKPPGGW